MIGKMTVLALIGSLLGFFTSLVPDIFSMMKSKADKKHELECLKLNAAYKVAVEDAKTDQENIKNSPLNKFPYKFVEAVTCMVRPLITYCFFALYCFIKTAAFFVNFRFNHDAALSFLHVWNDEDYIIFSAIISFWFGHRAFRRHGRPIR